MKLTVTVITRNEGGNLAAALQSVSWADEIVVVDAHSTDDTVDVARRHGARVEVRDWPGYGAQKNHAADSAANDWILSIDADERVTPPLAAEISDLIRRGPDCPGYRMPRVTWYLGRWIRSTDWYPDYQLRLYDRRSGRWSDSRVHESIQLQGTPGLLRHELQHFAYRDISHHLATIDRYTTLAAEQRLAAGVGTNVFAVAVHPPLAFLRNYVLRAGIRDGAAGFLVSVLNSYYVFLKLAKLWEQQRGTFRRAAPQAGGGDRAIPSANVAAPGADRRISPPEAQAPSPESRAQSPESGSSNPEARAPSPEPRD